MKCSRDCTRRKVERGSSQNVFESDFCYSCKFKQYGETDVLEFVIHKKRSEKIKVGNLLDNEVKMKITV